MVAASKRLLRMARKMAIRDELLAMRLRGRLIAPAPATKPSAGR